MQPSQRLTFVTVVFEAELELLEIQARSFAAHADPAWVAAIIVVDNTARGLTRGVQRRLLRAYGPMGPRMLVVRLPEVVELRGRHGWRRQQIAKLTVSRFVPTPDYVALDAKNHFIRRVGPGDFIAPDGRARLGRHSYQDHPLRGELEHTLQELGVGEELSAEARGSFPVTATPFVLRTDEVAEIVRAFGSTEREFADAFLERGFLEFFLYSAWVTSRGPGFDAIAVDDPIQAPTIWPSASSAADVRTIVDHAGAIEAPILGVHRRSLAGLDAQAVRLLIEFWTAAGIADSSTSARIIRRFRRRYRLRMVTARVRERWHATVGRVGSRRHRSPN